MDILRFATAGSVDDGKSTLIGRLLYDSKSIFTDQLDAVERTSVQRGDDYTDLALLTDGLRAEREQGITIDVAYRYFSTPLRKFIIADTPGHIQYTRNMVTGASTADLAIILIDARKGLLEQSRRHAAIVSLLRVPHVVLAINKMDLVDWSQEVYEQISTEFRDFAARLDFADVTAIPLSALTGDNVVTRSDKMPWYEGSALLHHLEHVYIASDRNLVDVRFPVQYVIRSQNGRGDFRGFAGQLVSGVIRPGDEVIALPSGLPSRVRAVSTADGELTEAYPPMSITVQLEDEVDISRGDMISRPHNQPVMTQDIDAMVCWMDSEPMRVGRKYALKHTTRSVRTMVKDIQYELDINSLQRELSPGSLGLNGIGRVTLRTTQPLLVDPYRRNRQTGSFIIIDEATNRTVGAGFVTEN